ncbi:MAG TPA: hypothetical protein VGM57_02640 [Pseudolabrys sp.]|jgi:hypothetical protein
MAEVDEKPLETEAAGAVQQVRRLMLIATATTFVAVAMVFGVIGYRVFKSGASAPALSDAMAQLPAGGKIVSTAVGDNRIVLTVDVGGSLELHIFDLNSLKPVGRMRFAPAP